MYKVQRVGNLKLVGIAGCNGLGGSAGSGKDTFADYLIARDPGLFIKYNLADPIKQIAMDVFGFTHDEVYTPKGKEQMNPYWSITPRRFLQVVGTEMFREKFRQDVWTKLAELKISKDQDHVYVMPDIRFDNEVEFIHRMGGLMVMVRTSRKVGTGSAHSSEKQPVIAYPHYVIENDQGLAELQASADEMYDKYFKKKGSLHIMPEGVI